MTKLRHGLRPWTALALCVPAAGVSAHVLGDPGSPAMGWSFEPLVLALLLASAGVYIWGYRRLYLHSGLGRPVRRRQGAAFAVGWLALVAAFVSPLDTLGAALFSAHMLQHEILMIVAAPLLVLGRPLAVWLWALPEAGRARMGRVVRGADFHATWRWLTLPVSAWALHAAALWLWHVPRFFEAALLHSWVHALQHTSFLGSALLFWWTILGPRAASRDSGTAMLSVFTTMVHTTALGALLTLAPGLWYPLYVEPTSALGFDPLQDQQLGGLVMWVPGGLAYLAGGLAVAARWLVASDGFARSLRARSQP